MSRTVTALYDTKAEAEAARERLSSEVDVEGRAKIMDASSVSDEQRASEFHSVPLSGEDREAYGEGLRRGGFMLCAEVDDDEDADKIVSILEQTSSVDLDERQNSWRSDGWRAESGMSESSSGQNGSGDRGNIVAEERIPVVEEQLRVGKREEQRGGARVRSYVEERPVSEQVNLREEHVNIERRPVDRAISPGELDSSGLLQEREIEMRETAEEPVVAKEARVKEEVVVQKTANERLHDVQDTVRETKVEVDEDPTGPNS
jgi:stress response protein YsnF